MRPSSNSFSGASYAHRRSAPGMQYEAPLGLSTSSSSAPASTVMRSTAAAEAAMPFVAEPQALPPIVSEATLMQAHSDMDRRESAGRGRKYLGLGGPLGLGARRATPLRSVTTAAVLVRSPYAQTPARTSPSAAERPQPPRMHSTSQLPLLLSPINPPQLPGTMRSGSFSAVQISLAGIRDAKEGPRRLPSISDSMRHESPPAQSSCSPGGLGIFNAGVSSRASSLLPSPMPTPRQSLPGFDADRVSPPSQRGASDSLSLLASAADRAQGRHTTQRNASGHHPYMRAWRRGPSARSVSLKQSEDIRQLGALDQSLKLK
ncbi:hypothetical protein IWW50_004954 [Coemansia erecta]|nr:hypothetical protein IWW50_004954 [Coemansia erecta]